MPNQYDNLGRRFSHTEMKAMARRERRVGRREALETFLHWSTREAGIARGKGTKTWQIRAECFDKVSTYCKEIMALLEEEDGPKGYGGPTGFGV